jgi:hypothetical protein
VTLLTCIKGYLVRISTEMPSILTEVVRGLNDWLNLRTFNTENAGSMFFRNVATRLQAGPEGHSFVTEVVNNTRSVGRLVRSTF